jgi:hypothetical protein
LGGHLRELLIAVDVPFFKKWNVKQKYRDRRIAVADSSNTIYPGFVVHARTNLYVKSQMHVNVRSSCASI